jgi:hypothetical protein
MVAAVGQRVKGVREVPQKVREKQYRVGPGVEMSLHQLSNSSQQPVMPVSRHRYLLMEVQCQVQEGVQMAMLELVGQVK